MNLNFYESKFYEGLLKMIFYKIANRESIEENLLKFSEELQTLQTLGYLDPDDPLKLTDKGLNMMDNSYNIGRMNFVRFINSLLRNSAERAGSFISRLLNLSSKRPEVLEEASRHLTASTIERLIGILKSRLTEMNTSAISTTSVTLSEMRAKLDDSTVQ